MRVVDELRLRRIEQGEVGQPVAAPAGLARNDGRRLVLADDRRRLEFALRVFFLEFVLVVFIELFVVVLELVVVFFDQGFRVRHRGTLVEDDGRRRRNRRQRASFARCRQVQRLAQGSRPG